MLTRYPWKAVLAAIIAAAGLHQSSVRAQSEKEAVIATAKRFFDGMRTKDTTAMASVAMPGAQLVIPSGPPGFDKPMPLSQFIRRAGSGTGPGGDEEITNPTVQVDGPMASLWAYYTYTPGGATTLDHCGVDVFLMQKVSGAWKIFHLAGTIRKTDCTPIH